MKIDKNVGKLDRITRSIIGLILITLGLFYFKGNYGYILAILGLIFLLVSITGFCFIYKICEIDTRKKGKKNLK